MEKYVNYEHISNEDTKNKINLIKGTDRCIKVENSSEKGKNSIKLENLNENVSLKAKPYEEEYKNDKEFQNDISKKNMQSNTINNNNKSEIETFNLKIKEITHNNNLRQTERKEPLYFYEKPTLIGLKKIGADSYMNASLQCLSQIENLTNYFLDENNSGDKIINNNIAKENENLPQLSPIYLELLKKLWDKNNIKGSYSPNKFKETIEAMNPLFELGQSDPIDFIYFFIEQLHIELMKDVSNNNNENNNYKINTSDQEKTFLCFLKDFNKKTTIISDIFFGIIESTIICLFCKEKFSKKGKPYPISYTYLDFNILTFPLEEIKKLKDENNMRSNMNIVNNEIFMKCMSY